MMRYVHIFSEIKMKLGFETEKDQEGELYIDYECLEKEHITS